MEALHGVINDINSFLWTYVIIIALIFMGFLCLTNLYAVARLCKYAFIALDDYTAQKNRGIEEPVFDANIMPNKEGVHAWRLGTKD